LRQKSENATKRTVSHRKNIGIPEKNEHQSMMNATMRKKGESGDSKNTSDAASAAGFDTQLTGPLTAALAFM